MFKLTIEGSKPRNKSWRMIKDRTTFSGAYDGQYGVYHRDRNNLLKIDETHIRFIADKSQCDDFMIEEFCELDVVISAKPTKLPD